MLMKEMNRSSRLLLIIGAALLVSPLCAQEIRLSNRFVNAVTVDPDDLVWVATEEGLNCFDGIRTRAFLKQTDGFPANLVNDVLADSQEPKVWVALQKAGLACYDKRTGSFVYYRAGDGEDKLSDDDITHLEQGPDGSVWLSTFRAGIDRLDPATGTFTRYNAEDFPGYRDAPLQTFALFPQRLILGYWSSGVSILSLDDHSRYDLFHDPSDPRSLPSDEVRSLLIDSHNRLWVGTRQGLALYSVAGRDFTVFLRGQEIFDLQEDSLGRLLVASGSGELLAMNISGTGQLPEDVVFQPLDIPGLGEHSAVRSVAGDRFGNLWIGTYDDGLLFRSGQQPAAGTLTASSPVKWKAPAYYPVPGRPDLAVRDEIETEDRIWLATDEGVYCVDRARRRVLYLLQRLELQPADLVRALVRDHSGNLWVGTYGGGLAAYNPQSAMLAQYDAGDGLGSDTVNDLLCDSQGRIWAATTAGLACFSDGPENKPVLYTFQDGLPDENIRALAEDAAGNLWMSSNSGISCLTSDERIVSFDARDGLPDGNYYYGAVAVLPDGRILFDGTDGTGWVDPVRLLRHKELPPVKILTGERGLMTDYRDNYLQVRFCVPDYAFSRSVEYAYRILDLDPVWHSGGPEVEFNHLPYGRHTLQVRARVHSQDWGEDYTTAFLEIRPPFWLTWWAKALYILLVLGAIAACGLYIYRRQARKNRERMRQDRLLQERRVDEERMVFYTNITHELRTPLTLILGPLEDLSGDEAIPAPARRRIGKVEQSAKQLLGLVNQILEFRKTETRNRQLSVSYGDFSRCVSEIGGRFRDLTPDKSVSFVLSVEPEVRMWYDQEAVTIILNNLLSNARKYTASGTVLLSLKRQGDKVAVCVTDTGCGISAEDLPHIFDRYYRVGGQDRASGTGIGLALVKNLCDLHHVELDVSSTPGEGTEFRLLFDPQEDYPEAQRVGPAPVEEEPEPEPQEEPGKVRILVVEDNTDILDYIQESLAPDFAVLRAVNGREGLKVAVREIPDIIVSDIMMPVMDGIDLCKAIRQDVRTSHIPVVLLTAKGSVEARTEGYEVGADSYLVKPFNKSLLLSRIHNLLEKQARLKQQVSESGAAVVSSNDLSPVDSEFLVRYNRFVEEHLGDEKIDIASLASEFAMSQSTLYRKVKAVSGLSPNELIRNIRLGKAAEMLLRTDQNISEISWATGFGSPVYFRNCFKERYGQTPTEYRETQKKAT